MRQKSIQQVSSMVFPNSSGIIAAEQRQEQDAMIRFRIFFGMLMMLGALATGTVAHGQTGSSEFLQVGAAGMFYVDGTPVTCYIVAVRNTTIDALGQVTRNTLSGNITMTGRLANQPLALNTGITSLRYEGEWAILSFPYASKGTVQNVEFRLKARSVGSLGQIQGAVQTAKGFQDFFNPSRTSLSLQEVRTFPFSSSGVTITYRRF
jgi:hypothetical protein